MEHTPTPAPDRRPNNRKSPADHPPRSERVILRRGCGFHNRTSHCAQTDCVAPVPGSGTLLHSPGIRGEASGSEPRHNRRHWGQLAARWVRFAFSTLRVGGGRMGQDGAVRGAVCARTIRGKSWVRFAQWTSFAEAEGCNARPLFPSLIRGLLRRGCIGRATRHENRTMRCPSAGAGGADLVEVTRLPSLAAAFRSPKCSYVYMGEGIRRAIRQ